MQEGKERGQGNLPLDTSCRVQELKSITIYWINQLEEY